MLKKIVKTLIFMIFLCLFILTMFLVFHLYKRHQNSRSSESSSNSVIEDELRQKAKREDKKKNRLKNTELLKIGIFLLEEKEKKISSAYLCTFDRQKKKLDFYFLEGNTLIELSEEAYREIKTKIPDMPQIIRFSHTYSYGKNKQGLEIATTILNDILESDIEYFVGLEEEVAKKIFYFNPKRDSVFLREFQNMLIEGSGIEGFLREHYKSNYTNFLKEEILSLMKECRGLKAGNIQFHKLPFVEKNRGILLEKEEVLEFIYGKKEKSD